MAAVLVTWDGDVILMRISFLGDCTNIFCIMCLSEFDVTIFMFIIVEMMFCTVCSDNDLECSFAISQGNNNFRRDKLMQHDQSKVHKLAKNLSATKSHTARDIAQPVSK